MFHLIRSIGVLNQLKSPLKTIFSTLPAKNNEMFLGLHLAPFRSCSTSITRTKKSAYQRMYKVRVMQPDGSTFTTRYHEPCELIRLPIDPSSLTEDEKKERLNRLKPEEEITVHEFDEEETEITQRSWKDFVPLRR